MVLFGALAAPVSAQGPTEPASPRELEARARFEVGRVAFEDGRFEEALRDFETAYALAPRPELLFNIGTTADRLRQDARAIEAFERYLAELPEAANRTSVEARLRVLRDDAARRAELGAALAAASPSAPNEDLLSQGWFWALVAGVAVVVGAGVTIGIVAASPGDRYEELLVGDNQRVLMALEARFP